MRIINYIEKIKKDSSHTNPEKYYLNGGCYIFAKNLNEYISGEILYLTEYEHFIVKYKKMYFDVTGNVTKKYSNSKSIKEDEVLKRKKIMKGIYQESERIGS